MCSGRKSPQRSLLQPLSQRTALSTIAAASQSFAELCHRDDDSGKFKARQPQRRNKQSPAPGFCIERPLPIKVMINLWAKAAASD